MKGQNWIELFALANNRRRVERLTVEGFTLHFFPYSLPLLLLRFHSSINLLR